MILDYAYDTGITVMPIIYTVLAVDRARHIVTNITCLHPVPLGKMDHFKNVPDNKIHAANMGPTWVLSDPGGPHVGPVNLGIRGAMMSGWWCGFVATYALKMSMAFWQGKYKTYEKPVFRFHRLHTHTHDETRIKNYCIILVMVYKKYLCDISIWITITSLSLYIYILYTWYRFYHYMHWYII